MHHMTFERFAVNGLKCAEAHVKRQLANLHAARTNFPKNLG